MNRRVSITLWSLLMVLLMASCSSTKTLKKSHSIEGMTESEYIGNVISNAGGWTALTAKMSLAIDLEGKGATKVNGTLRIKKGEVIQMSIAPLLGIEVARAEISPEGVLVIDRMNKRYVHVPFGDLHRFTKVKLDFHALQALFLNEIFLPGKEELSPRDISAFNMKLVGDEVKLDVRKSKNFSFSFLTLVADALLTESTICLRGTPYRLQWQYGSFRSLEHRLFPTTMRISFEGGKKPMNASISLSRLSVNSNWETHTKVSDKYEKVALEDLIKLLLKK